MNFFKNGFSCFSVFILVLLNSQSVFAETTVIDQTVDFSFSFPSKITWQSGTEKGSDGVTTCAFNADDNGNPIATICVKTLSSGTRGVPDSEADKAKFLYGILRGVCKPYQCPTGALDLIMSKQHGHLKGQQLITDLNLQVYKDMNLNGVIFFVALSPKGIPTLFTLNTAAGETSKYQMLFDSAVSSISYK